MKNYITTIKYFLPALFIVAFAFFGGGAPKAEAFGTPSAWIHVFPTFYNQTATPSTSSVVSVMDTDHTFFASYTVGHNIQTCIQRGTIASPVGSAYCNSGGFPDGTTGWLSGRYDASPPNTTD